MATMGLATGYQNLPSGNWVPAVYSQKVQKFFRRASVVEDITNTDYAGEIENFWRHGKYRERAFNYC